MEEAVIQKMYSTIREISRHQRKSFASQSRLLALAMRDPMAEPRVIAERYCQLYGDYDGTPVNGDLVITVYKRCGLVPPSTRVSIFNDVERAAAQINKVFNDNKEALPPLANMSGHKKRLILLALAEKNKILGKEDIKKTIFSLNKDFANECLDSVLEWLPPAIKTRKKDRKDQSEIELLRARLDRTNNLLHDLQESFEVQLEESKQEEQEQFFALLNSETYGHILDLLAAAQIDLRKMRRANKNIPFELRNIQTLVRRLLEFAGDFGVMPIQETGAQLTITAKQASEFQYEGNPFKNDGESKLVEIVSPGWHIPERDIIIARPRVREIITEELSHD